MGKLILGHRDLILPVVFPFVKHTPRINPSSGAVDRLPSPSLLQIATGGKNLLPPASTALLGHLLGTASSEVTRALPCDWCTPLPPVLSSTRLHWFRRTFSFRRDPRPSTISEQPATAVPFSAAEENIAGSYWTFFLTSSMVSSRNSSPATSFSSLSCDLIHQRPPSLLSVATEKVVHRRRRL